jgi:septal ring-binding cell division protein DamX
LSTTNNRQILTALGLVSFFMLLSACSSSPTPWTKQSSPWEQRKGGGAKDTAAPAAEEYRQELAEVDQSTSEVELSYQTEQVDSFAPTEEAEIVEAEPVEVEQATVESEPVDTADGMGLKEEILKLPAGYYTVQLMASVDVDRVRKFAEKNQVSMRYIVPTVRDGVTWHVLLLDVYSDRAAAKAGMNEIADSLKTQPWLRSMKSIQKLMQ